jgi:hypothetical protein
MWAIGRGNDPAVLRITRAQQSLNEITHLHSIKTTLRRVLHNALAAIFRWLEAGLIGSAQ